MTSKKGAKRKLETKLCKNKGNETYFGQNIDDCGDECEVMCGFASLANSRRVLGLTPITPRALWEQARAAGLIPTPFLGLGPKELCDVADLVSPADYTHNYLQPWSAPWTAADLLPGDVVYVSGVQLLNTALPEKYQYELPEDGVDSHIVVVASTDMEAGTITVVNPDRRIKAGRFVVVGEAGLFTLRTREMEDIWRTKRHDGTTTHRCVLRWSSITDADNEGEHSDTRLQMPVGHTHEGMDKLHADHL